MPYFYNTDDDRREMLEAIGAASVDELFEVIPEELRLDRPLDLPPALTEVELDAHLASIAEANSHAGQKVSFLGGGSYDHFIPAVVDAIASRGEFYTSYTPYQAEASQGNLQAMFEFQSLITRLTGMDVANSSLYDGASAAAEAMLMALRAGGKRRKVVVPSTLHPEYRATIRTYLECIDAELHTIDCPGGVVDPDELAAVVDDSTAAVLLQQPNFFGCIESVDSIANVVAQQGALLIAVFDPMSLGLLKRPGDWGQQGANIAVAEGQSLGSPMAYGGPYLGLMACDQALVRRMPGRIVGETTDRRGNRCFVLTLQTREQHIRRDKATSNVCTNQGLFALRATIFLAQLGPQGLRETAELCLQKSHYLAEKLCRQERFSLAFVQPTFKEFVIRDAENRVNELVRSALDAGFFAGIPLGRWYPDLSDCLLICVTEKRTRQEMDGLAHAMSQASSAEDRASLAHATNH